MAKLVVASSFEARNRSSLETDLTILMVLAIEKEYAQYYLPKKIGKDYRTVLRHIPTLENKGLIRLVRTEPATKHGKDRKIYISTLLGMVEFLKQPETLEFANQIVEKLAENRASLFPLILGKWTLFKNSGVHGIVMRRLWNTVQQERSMLSESPGAAFEEGLRKLLSGIYMDQKKIQSQQADSRKAHRMIEEGALSLRITRNVLLRFDLEEMKEQLALLSVLKQDSELREFVDSEFANRSANLQSWMRIWKGL